jgi:hypothetical protein
MASDGRMSDDEKRTWKEAVVRVVLYYPSNSVQRMSDTYSLCLGRDWNSEPPEYKSRVLSLPNLAQ